MQRRITAEQIRTAIQNVITGPYKTDTDARRAVHAALNSLSSSQCAM